MKQLLSIITVLLCLVYWPIDITYAEEPSIVGRWIEKDYESEVIDYYSDGTYDYITSEPKNVGTWKITGDILEIVRILKGKPLQPLKFKIVKLSEQELVVEAFGFEISYYR